MKEIESLRNCHFLLENMKNGQKKKQNKTKLIQHFFATIFQNFYFKQTFMQTKLEFEYYIHICLKNSKRTRDVK